MPVPVAFFVFNRPTFTARVFERIAAARPARLFVIADGPRPGRPGEAEQCAAVRRIVSQVDWDCEVRTNFARTNLGCKNRVAGGLDWVFQQVDRAIVLEDDCLPHPTLFPFFAEMLDRFADDARVMMVTGTNATASWKLDRQSYHFSYCGSIWGWATWRRAWSYYDVAMRLWNDPEARQRMIDVFALPELYESRLKAYGEVAAGKVDTWDMQWSFARIIQSGLSVVPAVNLVSNLGFGPGATHTHNPAAALADLPLGEMEFPLRHNDLVAVDRQYDLAFTRQAAGRKVPQGA